MPRKKPGDADAPTKSIKQIIAAIDKKFGVGTIKRGSDITFRIVRVPTGLLTIDRLLGGGIACGRFTELYGQYSTLKSYTASAAVAAFQRAFPDKECLWVDAEGSLDPNFLELLGVDLERLIVVPKPQHGEEITEIVEEFMISGTCSLFVVDSIAALMPIRETQYDADEGEKAMGSAGKMTSSMMRRLTAANRYNAALIILNQVRDQIGMVFGDPTKPTGGRAIPFYAGQRMDFRRGENIKSEEDVVGAGGKVLKGRLTQARVVNLRMEKDKTAPREGVVGSMLWIPKELRIDEEEEMLILGIEDGIIERNAQSIVFFPNSKKHKTSVRGWSAAKSWLIKNEKRAEVLRGRINKRSEELGHALKVG